MAVSLSRPDPTSPASVSEAGFTTVRRGYNPDEVRAFLSSIAVELRRLRDRNVQLESQLADVSSMARRPVEIDEDTVARYLGQETTRVLQSAHDSASAIKIRAEEGAAELMREASDQANELRRVADLETAQQRKTAIDEGDAIIAQAKSEGRAMVAEARNYRERVLADLERRTNLAREQLAELENARQRLLQVFERSRLVAIDVSKELNSLRPPSDVVDLSPVTGPVPVIVPASSRPLPSQARGNSGSTGAVPSRSTPVPEVQISSGSSSPEPASIERTSDSIAAASAAEERVQESAATTVPVDDPVERPNEQAVSSGTKTNPAADELRADETGGDPDSDETVEGPDARNEPSTSNNVVDLFRSGGDPAAAGSAAKPDAAAAADDAESPDAESPDAGSPDTGSSDTGSPDTESPDVESLFARLREGIEHPDAISDHDQVEPTESASEQDAAEVDPAVDEPGDGASDEIELPTAFIRRDETLAEFAPMVARHLKRLIGDQQNSVLHRLGQSAPVSDVSDLLSDDGDDAYRAAIRDDLIAAASAGAAVVDGAPTPTANALEKSGVLTGPHHLLNEALINTLNSRIERAVDDANGDNKAISKRVRAIYREIKTQIVDTVSADLIRTAFGAGVAAAVPPSTPLLWVVDTRSDACPDCEDNSLSPTVAAGDEFPTGHIAAPAHPGCGCLALPAD